MTLIFNKIYKSDGVVRTDTSMILKYANGVTIGELPWIKPEKPTEPDVNLLTNQVPILL